jgi:hypothetical protein
MRRIALALALAAPLAAGAQLPLPPPPRVWVPVPRAYAPPPPPPPAPGPAAGASPYYFNLGLGYGNGSTEQYGAWAPLHEWLEPWGYDGGRIAWHAEGGVRLSPQVLVGLDLTGLTAFGTAPYGSGAGVTIVDYDVVLTLFPLGSGPFLRGGAGLATIGSSAVTPGLGAVSATALGTNVLLGAGWAFPVGGPLAVTLGLDWSRQFFATPDVTGSSAWMFRVGVGWY